MSEWESRALDAEAEAYTLRGEVEGLIDERDALAEVASDAERIVAVLEGHRDRAIALHRMVVVDNVPLHGEIECCEECGHVAGEPPDDECKTVQILKGMK